MRILHTSDWHLGHMLYGYDRTEEQQSMLDQMVEIVRDIKPVAFILAGDVYVPLLALMEQKGHETRDGDFFLLSGIGECVCHSERSYEMKKPLNGALIVSACHNSYGRTQANGRTKRL